MNKKLFFLSCFFLVFGMVATSSGLSVNPITNGGFETGDFIGWDVSVPTGFAETVVTDSGRYAEVPAGSAEVVTEAIYNSWGYYFTYNAVEGENFAVLGTGEIPIADWVEYGRIYETSASQSIYLVEKDVLSGNVAFFNGDYLAQDSAYISIFLGTCNIETVIWEEHSGTPGYNAPIDITPYQEGTPWEYWEWVAPETGLYNLQLFVEAGGDNYFGSYAMYDNIRVDSVPEPSTLLLYCTGLVGIGIFRKKLKA